MIRHLFVSLNLIDKWTAVLTIKHKIYNLQPFMAVVRDICTVPKMTTCSYRQIQPPHNDVFPPVKDKRDILTKHKDMNIQFPLIHPQLQVS